MFDVKADIIHVLFSRFAYEAMEHMSVPHGVQDGAVLHDAEQLVGGRHVVGHRLLAVPEEGVWCPHFGHHQVVQPQNLYRALVHQPAVHPRLSKEHVHGVLLRQGGWHRQRERRSTEWRVGRLVGGMISHRDYLNASGEVLFSTQAIEERTRASPAA